MKSFAKAFGRVFRDVRYGIAAIIFTVGIFSFVLWFPNRTLIVDIFKSSHVTIIEKLKLLLDLWGGIYSNFTTLSAIYTIFIAVFAGIYMSLLLYYVRRKRRDIARDLSLGVGGIFSGLLGIGCAACGSFLFATFLSALGAGGAVALLPLGGVEFGILGCVLLASAIFLISKKINDPAVCPVIN